MTDRSLAAAATTGGFVHLHVHSEFSKQDSTARVKNLAGSVAADGQPAVASTDHGNMAGAWKFTKAMKGKGVKPIQGIEAYMALVPDGNDGTDQPALAWDDPQVRFAKTTEMGMDAETGKVKRNTNNHLTILVENETGWRNLCAMMNAAEDSFYYKALIDYALLKKHGHSYWDDEKKALVETAFPVGGLIVLSGCLGGPVASRVAAKNQRLKTAEHMRRNLAALPELPAKQERLRALQTGEPTEAAVKEADVLRAEIAALTPLTDAEVLAEHEQKIVALEAEAEDLWGQAKENLNRLIACVGKSNVYVEIMEHGLEAEGLQHIKDLITLAKDADLYYVDEATGERRLQVVVTNDCHYINECDCDAHDSWLVNGELSRAKDKSKVSKNDPDRWRFNGTGYWMRTEAEMRALYPNAKSWQTACDETVHLANRVEDDVIPFKKLRLPKFPVPADVVKAWGDGEECTVTDIKGDEFPARRPAGKKRGYRTPSAYYLHTLVLDGAKKRYGTLSAEVKERLAFEFDVITGLGLEDYFLIVRDVIEWCRSDRGWPTAEHPQGRPAEYDADGTLVPGTGKKPILVGPGRGSAAGSAVSYCIGIVQVCPLRWGLLFERFLDIDRVGMPDIDVDFEAARRGEVYEYLAYRYDKFVEAVDKDGQAVLDDQGKPVMERQRYVARIGAFQVAKTKRAIKDAARVLDVVKIGDDLAKLVPVHQGKPQSFAFLFEEPTDRDGLADPEGTVVLNPEAAEFRATAELPVYKQVVELARAFEDVVAGEGIHAAGVIISDEPLNTLIPMRADRNSETGVPIALWDGKDIDAYGMLKLDALSIDNLDFLAAAVEHIERTHGETVDPDNLPDPDDLSDPKVAKTYELLRAGGTEGVFQMESSGLTELTVSASPTQFEDISALLALYRPGPMGANMHTLFADRKTGRAPVDYGIFTNDPAEAAVIESVLGDTQGVIVYQEQLMFLAGKVAGFNALERSDLRKAVSKKIATEVERLGVIFMTQGQQEMTLEDGTHKIAFRVETLERLWTTFQASAAYLFNKSHTVAYGYLSYVTAYFSANYPVEYAAGVLGVSKKKADKRLATIQSLHRKGIAVLPPDVNRSMADTAPDLVDPTAIRPGLTEIRDVGSNGLLIVAERERNGEFTSMFDLMSRVKVMKDGKESKLSVAVVEGLIEAGAFDSLHGNRMGLMLALRAVAKDSAPGVPDAEWSPLERSARQRVRIGLALGEHPLSSYRETLREFLLEPVEDRWGNLYGGRPVPTHRINTGSTDVVITLGLLTAWAERTTRKGSKMANFTIEGTQSNITGTAFGEAISSMRSRGRAVEVGDIVAVAGKMKTWLITNTVMNDEGEEVEETREVSELIATHIEVVTVSTEAEVNLPEVTEPVNLATVIPLARARAAKVAEAKAAAKKQPTKAKASTEPAPDPDLSDEFPETAPPVPEVETDDVAPAVATKPVAASAPGSARERWRAVIGFDGSGTVVNYEVSWHVIDDGHKNSLLDSVRGGSSPFAKDGSARYNGSLFRLHAKNRCMKKHCKVCVAQTEGETCSKCCPKCVSFFDYERQPVLAIIEADSKRADLPVEALMTADLDALDWEVIEDYPTWSRIDVEKALAYIGASSAEDSEPAAADEPVVVEDDLVDFDDFETPTAAPVRVAA